MKLARVIPRLDIKGSNLVKGINFEGLRVLGRPHQFAEYYYHSGADELLYVDVVASLYQRNSLIDIIEATASSIFIPLTVAGGLRKLEDIYAVLKAGADKVAINTAALERPDFISEAASKFGSSTVVLSIEVAGNIESGYTCYTDNGRNPTGIDPVIWAKKAENLGAGEILLTSVGNEGTQAGFDCKLITEVTEAVSIPVIACGGCGSYEDILQAFDKGADAVSIAALLHYDAASRLTSNLEGFTEGNLNFLKSIINNEDSLVSEPSLLKQIKGQLVQEGYCSRN